MTKEQIVALGIKLFAVFLLIYGIRSVAYLLPLSYFNDMSGWSWVMIGVFSFAFCCIALVLWFFPLIISRKLLPADDVKEGETIASIKDIDVIAFSIVGLLVLATAVPDIFYWILMWSVLLSGSLMEGVPANYMINTVVTVFELIIGFWLLLGARGLRGFIRRLRYAGT